MADISGLTDKRIGDAKVLLVIFATINTLNTYEYASEKLHYRFVTDFTTSRKRLSITFKVLFKRTLPHFSTGISINVQEAHKKYLSRTRKRYFSNSSITCTIMSVSVVNMSFCILDTS